MALSLINCIDSVYFAGHNAVRRIGAQMQERLAVGNHKPIRAWRAKWATLGYPKSDRPGVCRPSGFTFSQAFRGWLSHQEAVLLASLAAMIAMFVAGIGGWALPLVSAIVWGLGQCVVWVRGVYSPGAYAWQLPENYWRDQSDLSNDESKVFTLIASGEAIPLLRDMNISPRDFGVQAEILEPKQLLELLGDEDDGTSSWVSWPFVTTTNQYISIGASSTITAYSTKLSNSSGGNKP